MHGPAKTASLEIGFEGSNPSLHAIQQFNKEVTTMWYESNWFAWAYAMLMFNASKDWFSL